MNIIINQYRNRDYFLELHDEYHKRKGKFKFFISRIIGILNLLTGLLIYLAFPNNIFSFIVIPIGIFQLVEFYLTRKKFVSRYKNVEKDWTIILNNDSITLKSHSSESIRKWDYYIEIIETDKGIFLIPEEITTYNDSLYIQKSSLDSKNVELQIIKMINRNRSL